MDVSGEFKITASPKRIIQVFQDPEILRQAIPNCQTMRQIGPGLFEAQVTPVLDQGTAFFLYHFRIEEVVKDREISLSWTSEEPSALLPNGSALFTLTPHKSHTQVSHQVQMTVNPNGGKDQASNGKGIAFITALTDRFAEKLRHHAGANMTEKKDHKNFDDALHSLEDAAVELEHEAEVAAGKGVFGGAQMRGWIALALIVLVLIFLT
jgi:carbon monoxide dehydrogenase subunit G